MSATKIFEAGGYRFIPAVFQYSSGVAALEGYAIRRHRLARPVSLEEGFALIERTLQEAGRPLTAFCACELRSPGQFSDAGFRAFNQHYVETLRAWGLFDGETNPVARSNVCPKVEAPRQTVFHAFSYTVPQNTIPTTGPVPSFVISGSGEARAGDGPYAGRIIRLGDTSPDAMREKAAFVLGEMERRLASFGSGWSDTTATHVYTLGDIHPFLETEILRRGAGHAGIDWHFCRPPVEGLEYEMDCRAVHDEQVLVI